MKTEQQETKFKSTFEAARHLFCRLVCLGAVSLICSSAPAQNLFVSVNDAGGGKIVEFTPDGVQSTFASGLDGLGGLAFDNAGNLFVADIPEFGGARPGKIYKFNPDGARSTFAVGLISPTALAVDRAGNLFVADGDILKFTPQGLRTTFASGVGGPMAIDSSGNLFVANSQIHGKVLSNSNGRSIGPPFTASTYTIYKFAPDGARSTFASGRISTLGYIVSLGVDHLGNLYVVDSGDFVDGGGGSLFKVTPDGKQHTISEAGPSCDFVSLAVDSIGNVFVTDDCTGIDKFTRNGGRSTFASGVSGALAIQPITSSTATVGNISTRGTVEGGENVLIGGFIITGPGEKKVEVRAIGPSLAQFGLNGVLADPTLELHDAHGAVIATNDNWKDSQQIDIVATGLAPTNDLESAIVISLPPGTYTAIVRGKNGGTGMGLVETYDADPAAPARLVNISTRGFVSINDNVMIGGFVVTGTNGSARILSRAIGPSLTPMGVQNALADPTLSIFDENGTAIMSNDNWKDTQQTDITASGHAPTDDHESAIVTALPSGRYTAIIRGVNNSTGVGLVEIFYLP